MKRKTGEVATFVAMLFLAVACAGGGSAVSPTPPTVAPPAVAAPPQVVPAVSPQGASAPGSLATAPVALPSASAVAAASVGPMVAPRVTPPAGAVKIKGAYAQLSSVQGALYVARDLGFFAREGLDVDLSMVGGTAQVAALGAGDIQFAALGANEVANADVGGASIAMIATCSDFPIFSLYANSKYLTVADLAGESIGITNAGSATDAAAHLFLKHFNMTGNVKIVGAGGTIPAIMAAVTNGLLAGGILSPPTTKKAADAGLRELVNGAKLGVPMNHSGLAVTRDFLKQHPDQVRSFVKAYADAWTYTADATNKAEVIKVLETYTRTDQALATIGYDAMVPVWTGAKTPRVNPEAIANLLAISENPKLQNAKPEQFIDNSIIDSIVR